MTEINIQSPARQKDTWYARLDRFLLNLLAFELGYLIFLIFAGIVVSALVYLVDFWLNFSRYATSLLWPVLPFIIAVPLNMIGGFISIVLNIRMQHQGYPGTGHLLNWIFLMTTGWLFILVLVFILPNMMTAY